MSEYFISLSVKIRMDRMFPIRSLEKDCVTVAIFGFCFRNETDVRNLVLEVPYAVTARIFKNPKIVCFPVISVSEIRRLGVDNEYIILLALHWWLGCHPVLRRI